MVEDRTSSWERAVSGYLVLLAAFVEGRVTADDVERDLEPLYHGDPWPPEVFEILDRFVGDVEAYRAAPDPDAAEVLRGSAQRTVELLESVLQED